MTRPRPESDLPEATRRALAVGQDLSVSQASTGETAVKNEEFRDGDFYD